MLYRTLKCFFAETEVLWSFRSHAFDELLRKIEIFFLTSHTLLLYSIWPFVMWVLCGLPRNLSAWEVL